MAQGPTRGVPIDIDGTLANNSDLLVPSQKAVVAYVTSGLSSKQNALGFTPLNRAGDTMLGNLLLSSNPTFALQAATKDYVDTLINGIDWKQSAVAATVAALPAYTVSGSGTILTGNANGAIPSATTDGITLVATNRVLVKDETSTLTPNNGIYVVTQVGNGSTPFILTRADDANVSSELAEATISIYSGATLSNTQWHCNPASVPITLGTTYITFAQIGSGTYTATLPISITGNIISISQATTSTNGYLTSTDWNTFNNKQAALSGTGIVKSTAGTISYISGTSSQFVKGDGSLDSTTYAADSGVVHISGTETITGQKTFDTYDLKVIKNLILEGDTANRALLFKADYSGYYTANYAGYISAFATGVQTLTLLSGNTTGGSYKAFSFYFGSLSNATIRTYTMPDSSGTLALTSDLSSYLTTSVASSTYVPYTGATNHVILGNYYLQSEDGLRVKPSYTSNWVAALSHSGNLTVSKGTLSLRELSTGGGFFVELSPLALTATRYIDLPNKDGTVALTSDIPTLSTLGGVPSTRTLTINGVSYDLSADRSWTISAGLTGTGTSGKIPKFTSSTSIGDSNISDNGTEISTLIPLYVSGDVYNNSFRATQSGISTTKTWLGVSTLTTSAVNLNPATSTATITANNNYIAVAILDTTVTEAASGNHNLVASLAIKPITLANAGATASNGATVYIEDAVSGTFSAGTYALWVDNGITRLDGITIFNSDFYNNHFYSSGSQTGITVTWLGSSSTNYFSTITNNSPVGIVLPASGNFTSQSILSRSLTTATSGTHNFVSSLAIKPVSVTANLTTPASVTNGATLYIEDSITAVGGATITNNYSIWVDNGTVRLDGALELHNIANTTKPDVLYYDSTTKAVTYGTAPTGGGATATYVRTSFVATASQTTFLVTYTVGYIQVYLNGTLLNDTNDYTATNGTSVVLGVGANAGDIIETIAYNTTTISGTTPVTSGGTGLTSLTANAVILGNGTSNVQFVSPGANGNVLTSNGTTWTSAAPTSGGSPGGTSGQVQYNNGAGGFAGASNVEISGNNLKLVSTTDPSAPTGSILLYSKIVGGRHLPKIVDPTGFDTVMQIGLHGNSVFFVTPASGTTAPSAIGGTLTTAATMSAQQTIASANPWQATWRKRFQTSTTAGNATGMRTAYVQWFRGSAAGFGGFWFRAQLGMNINLNGGQKFVGLCASTAALAGEPSALLNMCGMGYDSTDASTGNWFFMYNDGTGTATKVNLGTNAARNTNDGYDLIMYMAPGGSELFVRIINIHSNVTVLDTSYTTLLPVADTGMAFKAEVRNGAVAAADNLEVSKVYIETDY